MKKSIIGVLCAAVFAAALLVPLGLRGAPASDAAIGSEAAAAPASSASGSQVDAEPGAEQPDGSGASPVAKSESGMEYEQGAVLVGLQDGVTAEQLNARLAGLDYIATKQVSDDDITLGYVKLNLAEGVDVKEAESRFAGENADLAKSAQPNYIYRLLDNAPASTTSSPSLVSGVIAQATAIDDARKSEQWALEAVHANEAWDLATVNGEVTVAVIDNGCLVTHEDLKNNIVATYNATDGSKDVSPVYDGHGTHVCGIVAAEANNGKGVAGVSYNAGLLPIQGFELFEDEGSLFPGAASINLCKAYAFIMKKAEALNIRVVNMSLGGYQEELDEEGADQMLIDAVSSAHDAGILTVCAAGNDADTYEGAYPNFPSDWMENSLGVIALEKTGSGALERVYWSNYNMEEDAAGKWKNISAPGVDILSCFSKSNSHYLNESGTSMAAPCVAGIAALVFAANPDLSADQARSIILETAQDIYEDGFDLETGWGLIDARAAVQKAVDDYEGGKTSLHDATITLSENRFTYNGTAWKPDVTVKRGSADLEEGKDYNLVYSNNVNAGKGKVTVTGTGSYTGVATRTFVIDPKQVNPVFKVGSCAWTGKALVPSTTVKVGSQTLKKGKDYTVTCSNNKNVGRGKATIKCKGNYKFTAKTLAFNVNPKGTAISKLTPVKNGFNVAWKRQAAKMPKATITGYQVQFSLNSKFKSGNKTLTIKGYKNTAKSIGKLKAKKRYYVRVRTFSTVGGKNYYSPWSPKKSVVTKA